MKSTGQLISCGPPPPSALGIKAASSDGKETLSENLACIIWSAGRTWQGRISGIFITSMTRLNHEKLAPAPRDSFAAADVFGPLMASDLSFASASEFNDLSWGRRSPDEDRPLFNKRACPCSASLRKECASSRSFPSGRSLWGRAAIGMRGPRHCTYKNLLQHFESHGAR